MSKFGFPSEEGRRNHIPKLQPLLAQNFIGHDMENWKCHDRPMCQLSGDGYYELAENFWKALGDADLTEFSV